MRTVNRNRAMHVKQTLQAAGRRLPLLNTVNERAIDKLVERLIFATDRADLVAATRALDRALLWNHYLVPHFFAPAERVAYWDRFGRPTQLPRHGGAQAAFVQVWWHDEAAAKRLESARRQ